MNVMRCGYCGLTFGMGEIHQCATPPPRGSGTVWTLPETQRHGDPRFYKLLDELADLHSRKSHDYTPEGDPLQNFKRAEKFGVQPWKGCLVRMGDKFGRLEQLASGKTAQNESLRDTLVDLAVYSLLCVLLLDESSSK